MSFLDEKSYGVQIDNKFYHPDVLKVIEDNKIPMWPFWSAAVARATYFPNFVRESNAVVESSFNLRKNIYRENKNVLHTDYAQEAYKYHDGTLKIASDKALQLGVKFKTKNNKTRSNETRSAPNRTAPAEEKTETWFRKTPKSRIPKHFTIKSPCKYTSPKSRPSSHLKNLRKQRYNLKTKGKFNWRLNPLKYVAVSNCNYVLKMGIIFLMEFKIFLVSTTNESSSPSPKNLFMSPSKNTVQKSGSFNGPNLVHPQHLEKPPKNKPFKLGLSLSRRRLQTNKQQNNGNILLA